MVVVVVFVCFVRIPCGPSSTNKLLFLLFFPSSRYSGLLLLVITTTSFLPSPFSGFLRCSWLGLT